MGDFGEIAERLRRSTVRVSGNAHAGIGSGIIWDTSGIILTNAHVARGQAAHVEFWDGTRLPATTIKHDARADLAALQVDPRGLRRGLPGGLSPACPGNSAMLRPGDL